MEIAIYCIATALVVVIAITIYSNRSRKALIQNVSESTQALRSLEKDFHQKEMVFINEKNKFIEEQHLEIQRKLEKAKQEGVLIGQRDAAKSHLIEIEKLGIAHQKEILKERVLAAEEAKAAQRAEFEQQVKLFSVKISPYVKIKKDTGIIYDSHSSEFGYQYQLLVNGIPAFSPHVIIERSEELKKLNQESIDAIVALATESAKLAASTYLKGTASGAVHMSKAVIEQTGK
ncbi:hypothetical protein ACBP93_08515 [Paenalcaligenes hominis]|uniref:hypothetical protein n=1 Tax=Paenalcaligenes hominis TaxID=643674 RepID=UPI0035263290